MMTGSTSRQTNVARQRTLATLTLAAALLGSALTACSPTVSPAQASNAPAPITGSRPGSNVQGVAPGFGSNASQPAQMAPPSAPANAVPMMDIAELRQRIAANDQSILLIDARLAHEYAAGHIPTAQNYNYMEMRQWLTTLPKDREIVVYCYGKGCGIARNVVSRLIAEGYPNVKDLDGGVSDWIEAGGELEK